MNWEEKRKYKRVYIKFPVQCKGRNYWQYVEARDISVGGMFVATEQVEAVNTKLEVMFDLSGDEKKYIRADAVVSWVRSEPAKDETGNLQPSGMGIQFTGILPLSAREYIEQLSQKKI